MSKGELLGRWVTIDGRPVYIESKISIGAFAATIGLGITVAFTSAGGPIGGGTDAVAAPEIGVSGSASVRSARTSKEKSDRTRARLSSRGFRADARADTDTADCADHAYGQVREYLREHPCASLQRGLFEVRPNGRDRVVVAVAWVRMPTTPEARELKGLADTPGTGNITDLDRRVDFTGTHYASSRDQDLVTIAEAEPDARTVPGTVLEEVAGAAASP